VIIPTWNRANLLKRAIQSTLNQSLPPLEILVCDDGSTDNTCEIVKSLNNPKVRLIIGQHSGLPAIVRNRGIKESRGEWLAFLDSDDWWEKDKLKKQLKLIKRTQIKAVCSNACVINSHIGKKERLYFPKAEVNNVFGFNELLTNNFIICSSFFVEKRLVEECGGFPEEPTLKAIEDYALWLRLSTKTKVAYSDKPLVNYFNDYENSVRNVWQNVKLQKKMVLQNFLKWLIKNFNKDNKQTIFLIKALIQYARDVAFY